MPSKLRLPEVLSTSIINDVGGLQLVVVVGLCSKEAKTVSLIRDIRCTIIPGGGGVDGGGGSGGLPAPPPPVVLFEYAIPSPPANMDVKINPAQTTYIFQNLNLCILVPPSSICWIVGALFSLRLAFCRRSISARRIRSLMSCSIAFISNALLKTVCVKGERAPLLCTFLLPE